MVESFEAVDTTDRKDIFPTADEVAVVTDAVKEREERIARVNHRRERWMAMLSSVITAIGSGLALNDKAKARVIILDPRGSPNAEIARKNLLGLTDVAERIIVDYYENGQTMIGVDSMPCVHVVIGRLEDMP